MRNLLLVLACLGTASVLGAQSASTPGQGPVLTLADALTLARQNNPGYLTAQNAQRTADAQLRAAYGAFLPGVNTNFSGSFREGRQEFFGGVGFGATNDQLNSSGSISAGLQLSMGAIYALRAQRASNEAVEADVSAAENNLRQQVTAQFITARQAEARAILQDTLLATTRAQLELAQARLTVGSGNQLEVQRAEVANGQQRVAALNARNTADIEVLRLYQLMGVPAVAGTRLEGPLDVTLPSVALADLLDQAQRANPTIDAARRREQQATRGVSQARSAYLPSMSLSASVSGFTQRFTNTGLVIAQQQAGVESSRASCIRTEEVRDRVGLPNRLAQCAAIQWSPEAEQAVRDEQGRFPLDFTRQPYNLSASFSLPLFNGFRREADVQQATVQRRNAENTRRQEELRVTTEVSAAYLTLTANKQAVDLQEQNSRTARTALSLAEERYRAGAINLVELIQARTDFERAETDRINAIYDFQRAFAQLEAAVGRPLR
ncbi:MAG: TolC family protein [Gemmatimonadaceae bacterium]|jgi:outer membrane protein|nr:TolC family protein [Gemmatimonadaceae bacterium]